MIAITLAAYCGRQCGRFRARKAPLAVDRTVSIDHQESRSDPPNPKRRTRTCTYITKSEMYREIHTAATDIPPHEELLWRRASSPVEWRWQLSL